MSDEPAVQEGVTAASEDPPPAVAYPRYTADDNQLFAINRCRDLVIAAGEDYLNGWVLVSINQWDQEQERVLLLTNKALYRVKYDFGAEAVERYERVPLKDVRLVQVGPLRHSKLSFSGLVAKGGAEPPFGLRVHCGDPRPANPFARDQPARTFRMLVPPGAPRGTGEFWVRQAVRELADARVRVTARQDGFDVAETVIARNNYLGPVSTAFNKLGLGMFGKSGTPAEKH